ncbi:MAG: hypothetical protein K6L75_05120 [Cellvibrionaceae bacterium]
MSRKTDIKPKPKGSAANDFIALLSDHIYDAINHSINHNHDLLLEDVISQRIQDPFDLFVEIQCGVQKAITDPDFDEAIERLLPILNIRN